MRSLVLGLVMVLSSTAWAGPGHVPRLFVSTDWGAQLLYNDNRDASGGLTATLRHPMKNVLLYGDVRTLFLGGNFGVRGGAILGPSYTVTNSDTRVDSISKSYSANASGGYTETTTYNTTTTTYRGQEIRGVIGLALSASTNTFGYGDGSNAQLEAGFGMCAQNCVELQYIVDVANDGKGFRLAGTYAKADRTSHFAFRYSIEGLWGDELPSYGIITVGVGLGSGYHF